MGWLSIAGARLGLNEIRSIGGGRVSDGEALVGSTWTRLARRRDDLYHFPWLT